MATSVELMRRGIGNIDGFVTHAMFGAENTRDPEQALNSTARLLNASERTIRMVSKRLPDERIMRAMTEASGRDVSVELILMQESPDESNILGLTKSGIRIYLTNIITDKYEFYALIDDQCGILSMVGPWPGDVTQHIDKNLGVGVADKVREAFEQLKLASTPATNI